MNNLPSQDSDQSTDSSKLLCPQCESNRLIHRHCKTFCPTCGYVESCEDIFLPIQDNPVEVEKTPADETYPA